MNIINDSPVEETPLEFLKQHPRNPRIGDLGLLGRSIEKNGFYGAIVVQRSTKFILAGNHRFLAARAAGALTIPVIWVDVDDQEATRILLADNRTSDLATYDEGELARLLEELEDLDGSGYTVEDLASFLDEPGDPLDKPARADEQEELLKRWKVEPGDLYSAGKHRLLCGDSTNEEDVTRLLGGEAPALMITDPPYGVNYDPGWRSEAMQDGANRREGKVSNDQPELWSKKQPLSRGVVSVGKVEADDRASWLEAWKLAPVSVAYVWHDALQADLVLGGLREAGFVPRSHIIWAKNCFPISRGHYHWKHEVCFYLVKKGATASWIGDRKQNTLWDIELNPHNIREEGQNNHGTQKPIECMERAIINHEGDVYEPFAGTGTTIIAAQKQGRACYAMEIDPGYFAVILQRLEDNGIDPVKL